MRNKKNPLIEQDNWHGKLFFRWLFIILYLLYFILLVIIILQDMSSVGSLSSNDKDGTMTDIVLLILFSLFIFGRLLKKSARNSMSVMKHICSYEEVYTMLENQTFTEIKNVGYEKIYESELWLKLDGKFIPKNFIVSGYYSSSTNAHNFMWIVLINGRRCLYKDGMKWEDMKMTTKTFRQMVPNGDFIHQAFWWCEDWKGGKIKKILKERYEKYISEGHTVQELVNNHVDFTKGIEMKYK